MTGRRAELGPAELGPAELGPAELGPAELGSAGVRRVLAAHALASVAMSLPWPLLLLLVWEDTGSDIATAASACEPSTRRTPAGRSCAVPCLMAPGLGLIG